MKMKRLLAWILVFVLCFSLVSCSGDENESSSETASDSSTSEATESSSEKGDISSVVTDISSEAESTTDADEPSESDGCSPLLYRVSDESGNVIWLFGAIHLGQEEFYPLPEYVMNAYEDSDKLAVEADIVAFEEDMGLQVSAVSKVLYTDGTTIEDHISPELYEEAVEILDGLGAYSSIMDMYCPFFWSSLIESFMVMEVGARTDLGIDRFFIESAYEDGKDIVEIESAEFQYEMMADFDDEVQTLLLEDAVDAYNNYEDAIEDLEIMLDLWMQGDEAAFSEYLSTEDSGLTDEEKEIYERYNKVMATDRNLSMADFAEDALANGEELFICVGAAHIVGEGALAELLAERGYTVECIS